MRKHHQATGHKKRWMLGGLLCAAISICAVGAPNLLFQSPVRAQVQAKLSQAQLARVDATLLPLKKGELEKGLKVNVNNAHGLVLWLLRADEQGKNDEAMRVMQQLRRQRPNNYKVLAAYLFELDIEIQGNHRERSVYKPWTSEQKQDFHQSLQLLYQKAPELWLPYAIDGYRQFYLSGDTPKATQNRGINLLKNAVRYGPRVPLAHYRLARACDMAASWQKRPELLRMSIAHCEKSLRLSPPSSSAAFFALMSYNSGWIPGQKPDRTKAKMAAKRFLATLPPGTYINKAARDNLAMAGVPQA